MSLGLQTEGLLLPVMSVALVGGGREGADFLAQFGLASDDFDRDLDSMLDALDPDDPEASAKKAISVGLAGLARGITGWAAITSVLQVVHPTYVLRRGEVAIVVRPLGPVVEWLLVGVPDLARVVQAATAGFPDVLITAHQAGAAQASILLRDGEIRAAAKSQATLDALSGSTAIGFDQVVARLMDVIDVQESS